MIWQTRTICVTVAATVPVETKGDVSPLMEFASSIGEMPEDTKNDEQPISTDKQQTAVVDPNPGTYEAFMSSFGSPARWAGR